MGNPPAHPELMRSLGRLVRGLSALFWGLPATLVVCFHVARAESLRIYLLVPPLACTGLLLFGLWELTGFQKQERVWRNALDRALLVGLVNLGLSPFLYFSNKVPGNGFFSLMVILLTVSSGFFLASLNQVLQRLGAMLPDEALRLEIRQFTALNLNLLSATFLLAGLYALLSRFPTRPLFFDAVLLVLDRGSTWFLILLVLLPLAMTMALLWKTKEVILDSIFSSK